MRLLSLSLLGALLAYVFYTAGPFVQRTLRVLGAFRNYSDGASVNGEVVLIPDTVHCEDVHYHGPSETLFTACEDNAKTRFKWFPPLANFDDPELGSRSQGSIHVVNPKTMKSRRLNFENFDGPFITHGIDVISDSERGAAKAVYIFAVNHPPEIQASGQKGPYARSRLEVFHHVIGSSSIRHIRSIWHPLIRTPNDVFVESPTSIYVTNDHYYRFHGLMRTLEDMYFHARWTEVVHIQLDSLAAADPTSGVEAKTASPKMHNSNGLGHGRSKDEILISSCVSGILHIGRVPAGGAGNITITHSIELDHIADNPSYFSDPYATPNDDRSGYLEAGLSRGIDLASTHRDPNGNDPVMVTYIKPVAGGHWEKRVLLEDDGSTIRSASAAVLVAIDPTQDAQGGGRKAWLFTTGFMSNSMIATKVDL